jgi:hypothetical protein
MELPLDSCCYQVRVERKSALQLGAKLKMAFGQFRARVGRILDEMLAARQKIMFFPCRDKQSR